MESFFDGPNVAVPMSYDIGASTQKMLTHIGTHIGSDKDPYGYVVQKIKMSEPISACVKGGQWQHVAP
eukprot:7342601-Karenia_brevis.AAC.1